MVCLKVESSRVDHGRFLLLECRHVELSRLATLVRFAAHLAKHQIAYTQQPAGYGGYCDD